MHSPRTAHDGSPLVGSEQHLLIDVLAGVDAVRDEDVEALRRKLNDPSRPVVERVRILQLLRESEGHEVELPIAVAMSRLPDDAFDALGVLIVQHPSGRALGLHAVETYQRPYELATFVREPPRCA